MKKLVALSLCLYSISIFAQITQQDIESINEINQRLLRHLGIDNFDALTNDFDDHIYFDNEVLLDKESTLQFFENVYSTVHVKDPEITYVTFKDTEKNRDNKHYAKLFNNFSDKKILARNRFTLYLFGEDMETEFSVLFVKKNDKWLIGEIKNIYGSGFETIKHSHAYKDSTKDWSLIHIQDSDLKLKIPKGFQKESSGNEYYHEQGEHKMLIQIFSFPAENESRRIELINNWIDKLSNSFTLGERETFYHDHHKGYNLRYKTTDKAGNTYHTETIGLHSVGKIYIFQIYTNDLKLKTYRDILKYFKLNIMTLHLD